MTYNYASRMELAKPSFIRESLKLAADPNIISLAGGNPDADYFPAAEIAAAAAATLAGDGKNALQYSITEGNVALRQHLLKRMAAIGIDCSLEQLIITSGSQQGLDLSAKAFIDPGDVIVVESPTYMGAVNAFKYYQPRFAEAAMDGDGMDMDSLEKVLKAHKRVKFIYTIPDFQNPTGLVLAEERRRRLVQLAQQYETLVIEDNPYYFMRFSGPPIPPIKHFDTCGRVVYLGSISKVLCPALRVGWVIAERELTDKYVYLKQAADLHTNELSQRIIAQYLDSFDLDAHIAAMNAAYKQKKDLMVKLIRELFPPSIHYTCPDGGLFLWLTLPEGCDALQIFNYAYEKERVIFVPGDTFYPYGGHANTARLSFATVTPEKIEEGMRRLARVFASTVKQWYNKVTINQRGIKHMAVNLKGRSFLTLMDFTPEEIRYLLDLSHDLKAKKRAGLIGEALRGKSIVLLFEKTSTRTRCAFEVAAMDEGAHVTFLDSSSSQMGKKESLEDTAKVLGRYYDGIEYRGYKQQVVEDLARFAGVPVFNGLTDVDHPTQILADLLTIEEHVAKPLSKIKVVFCGDIRNNMAYAWMYGCAKMGMHFVAYGPAELQVDAKVLASAREVAAQTGATIEVCHEPSCLKGADVLYSDVWASMGEEAQIPERVRMLTPYRITMETLTATGNADVIFLHCLPSFHDFETIMAKSQMDLGYDIREVTDEVFRSRHSKVFDEAENRMHTIKAVMVATMG